jgi:hypothetical protein
MQSPSTQLIYVVVFGYPADRYAATVEFFRSLGDTATEADPHAEIINAFRIGFRNPTEAIRAMRKNGEVIGGSWMIGVKWAVSVLLSPYATTDRVLHLNARILRKLRAFWVLLSCTVYLVVFPPPPWAHQFRPQDRR